MRNLALETSIRHRNPWTLTLGLLLLFPSALSYGIGLNGLSPDTSRKALPPKPKETGSTAEDLPGETGVPKAVKGKKAGETKSLKEEAAAAPILPSELSLKLKDQLILGSSFGWVLFPSGSDGTWRGSGTNDLWASFKIPGNGGKIFGGDLSALVRYSPVALSLQKKAPDYGFYQLILSRYLFGALWELQAPNAMRYRFSSELAFANLYAYQGASVANSTPPSSHSVGLNFAGQVDWQIVDPAVRLGPRLGLYLGKVRFLELGANFSFAF